MMKKRFDKIKDIEDYYAPIELDLDGEADVGIISWGSTQGSVREAVLRLKAKGVKVAALYPKQVWPVPVRQIGAFAEKCNRILVPEVNYQGQFADLIRAATGLDLIKQSICGGLPFAPAEIAEKVEEVI